MSCPICQTHLHGHGWRKRYVEKKPGEFGLIWVHRKLCPHCRKTFTLIPSGMPSIHPYPLPRISGILELYMTNGHATYAESVPVKTQKRFWRNFMTRLKADIGMFPSPGDIVLAIRSLHPFSVLSPALNVFTGPSIPGSFPKRRTASHHRLELLLPATPP